MPGIKRKQATEAVKADHSAKVKKFKPSPPSSKNAPRAVEKPSKSKAPPVSNSEAESEANEVEDDFESLSEDDAPSTNESGSASDDAQGGVALQVADGAPKAGKTKSAAANRSANTISSKEAHAKQKALVKERKAAKPNADSIQRSKQIWERLRIKSAVPLEERKKLVEELYSIITGRVKDFVFKHDSVRVIQCALRYSNPDQRKMVARELRGDLRSLAESKYAKFLIAKMVVEGDEEIRDMIVSEFYGHVRRLINHPEASWILDDIYRGIASPSQKAMLLREWYGPEFAIFKTANKDNATSTLSEILKEAPEKRMPIMNYLHGLINQLIQKKMTGFTMLHDAMLQYFINTKPNSEEANEFLELIKGDEEGDLLKNLAFTKSGSRVVCLVLAYGNAKDRKNILKVYKENIELLAYDPNGHFVLLTAYDVIDDTVLTTKSIFPELIGKEPGEAQDEKVVTLANHLIGRIPLLYPLAGPAKWLLQDNDHTLLTEIHEIRKSTSKKDPQVRRKELVKGLSAPVVATVAAQAATLAETSFGCQFMTEVLLEAEGDKTAAVNAVADLAAGDPNEENHIARSPHGGRMLKTLVLGGRFDPKTKKTIPINPPLDFHNALYGRIKEHIVHWACGPSSFVVVNLLEADGFSFRNELVKTLKKESPRLEKAATEETEEPRRKREEKEKEDGVANGKEGKAKKRKTPTTSNVGNAGAKLLLEKLK